MAAALKSLMMLACRAAGAGGGCEARMRRRAEVASWRHAAGVRPRTDSFLGAKYRRLNKRMPKRKALVATGNSILTTYHALLSDPAASYHDLGPDYYDQRAGVRRQWLRRGPRTGRDCRGRWRCCPCACRRTGYR